MCRQIADRKSVPSRGSISLFKAYCVSNVVVLKSTQHEDLKSRACCRKGAVEDWAFCDDGQASEGAFPPAKKALDKHESWSEEQGASKARVPELKNAIAGGGV